MEKAGKQADCRNPAKILQRMPETDLKTI